MRRVNRRHTNEALLVSSAIVLMSVAAASAQATGSTANPQRAGTAPSTSSSSGAATQPNSTSAASSEPLRQQVRDNLTRAGFTDIKIMPTSFMVRAKNQSGNPVMMVINPDSFTEVTAIHNNDGGTQSSNKDAASAAPKH